MIVFASVGFCGHLNVIVDAAKTVLARGDTTVRLVILSWTQFPIATQQLHGFPSELIHVLEADSALLLGRSNPVDFNLPRAKQLLQPLLHLLTEWQAAAAAAAAEPIEWICYDFFCTEALFAAKVLRIPSICSVPAVPGTLWTVGHHSRAETMCEYIQKTCHAYKLNSARFTAIDPLSDFFYVPGSEQQWLWCHPALLGDKSLFSLPLVVRRRTRKPGSSCATATAAKKAKKHVYVCFGTVVTGNLWHKNDTVRPFVSSIVCQIVDWAKRNSDVSLTIAVPGLEKQSIAAQLGVEPRYCCLTQQQQIVDRISIVPWIDQQSELDVADLFVTHGGGNGTTEALERNVPMVVVPFFGDQHVCGERVEAAGFGLCWPHRQPNLAVDSSDSDVSCRVDNELLSRLERALALEPNSSAELPTAVVDIASVELARNRVVFHPGDLLLGSNVARKRFADCSVCSDVDLDKWLCLNQFEPPSTRFPIAPSLIDQYNDVFKLDRDAVASELAHFGAYGETLRQLHSVYKRESVDGAPFAFPPRTKQDLWEMCCTAIRHLLTKSAADKCYAPFLHFVVHEEYSGTVNLATAKEIETIRLLFEVDPHRVAARVRFYWLRKTGELECCSALQKNWFD